MKILKRLAYVILTVPVYFGIILAIILSPFYWIATGKDFVELYTSNTLKLSKYLRDEKH